MDYKDKVFATSFIGSMCCALGFVSIAEITESVLATKLGMMLGGALLVSMIGGSILYRKSEVRFIADIWALVVVGIPAVFFVFFSYVFAKQMLGDVQAIALLVIWIMTIVARIAVQEPVRVRAKVFGLNTRIIAVVAASGGVAIGIVRAINVMDGKIIVLVLCNLLLACVLCFIATGFAKVLFAR